MLQHLPYNVSCLLSCLMNLHILGITSLYISTNIRFELKTFLSCSLQERMMKKARQIIFDELISFHRRTKIKTQVYVY